ncbi:hypothetical protein [Flavobacterium gilvum]|uniref:Uncharacterized protein n=1 Tax=Flavobacterium gilvum TaxID=1492737 RepID=A0AAC9I3E8_9FLAO|nr:hypothetical protein [Flavobacterium gilvum]AOW08751.1 hypothetical protein EM308_04120 [Flavobacterium gilvum]KFC59808.1 hypothetical protein FEM08_13190 [Flavobacterium gilvum]
MKNRGIQLNDSASALENIDLKIDVIRDADGLITQGLVIGEIMNQNQALMLIANPGEFKFNPTLGVAIDELILDNDYLRMRHRIREHFAKDGLIVKNIELSEGKPLIIDASYE